ncbi:MAG: hypothetical protein JSR39_01175 [Verrucomicrobia bacterium]|nr:hypothetical protein [Verrucomicrobiota bacterium]
MSAFPQNFHAHSRLANLAMVVRSAPLSLKNFEKPPCQTHDSSSCFGIDSSPHEAWVYTVDLRSEDQVKPLGHELFFFTGKEKQMSEIKQI